MKLLVDANLSPRVAEGLRAAGFEAVPGADLGLVTASDDDIFDPATAQGFTVVTADSDFGMTLALRRATCPSIVSPAARGRSSSRSDS